MLNQILLYVAYGVGALFLVGGTILMIGILKASPEQAAIKKAAKEEAIAAKKAAKEDKKSTFGANKKKDFFVTNDIGEGGNSFQLQENEPVEQVPSQQIPSPAFEVPVSNTPPKSSFQAAAFAAKQGKPVEVAEPTVQPVAELKVEVEEELPKPKSASLPPTQNKSVFGGGSGFKLSEGSDTDGDNSGKGRFNLPF